MRPFLSILLIATLISPVALRGQNVYIPDANFKNRLIELGIDENNNGEISYGEAEGATTLDLTGQNIADLTGIEAFVNIYLLKAGNNKLSQLNIPPEVPLAYLYCDSNQLTQLHLDQHRIARLHCDFNQITELYLSNDDNNLNEIFCNNNELTRIEIGGSNVINYIFAAHNNINEIIVGAGVKVLDCSYNTSTEIDISSFKVINELSLKYNTNLEKLCVPYLPIDFTINDFATNYEIYICDPIPGNGTYYAGQADNTFNRHLDLPMPLPDTFDLNADGIDDFMFNFESGGSGWYSWTRCSVYPLNNASVTAQDAYYASGLSFGDTIFPGSLLWSKNELVCWTYEQWEYGHLVNWYLDGGYMAFQIPLTNDTLYSWFRYNELDLPLPKSYTCWKPCKNPLDIEDSISALTRDTILIDAGPGYDYWYWSTGDTNRVIEIVCSEWGGGAWDISVVAIEGACHYFDTINIRIEDDSGIPTEESILFKLGPNPFYDQITISNPSETEFHFDIINMLGRTIFSTEISSKNTTINLGALKPGIYLGSFYNKDQRMVVKMIKQ